LPFLSMTEVNFLFDLHPPNIGLNTEICKAKQSKSIRLFHHSLAQQVFF
jgi:hypothetical protein